MQQECNTLTEKGCFSLCLWRAFLRKSFSFFGFNVPFGRLHQQTSKKRFRVTCTVVVSSSEAPPQLMFTYRLYYLFTKREREGLRTCHTCAGPTEIQLVGMVLAYC